MNMTQGRVSQQRIERAARRGRPLAAALAAATCAVVLAGCNPPKTVTLTPGSTGIPIDGGPCSLRFTATGLAPNTTYGIGMYTTSSAVPLGESTANSSGVILGTVDYPEESFPEIYKNAYLGLYTITGGNLHNQLASAKLTKTICLAAGLAP